MNIIQKRQEQRKEIINRITQGLEGLIKKHGKNFPINFETMILTIQATFPCSRRTASEYLNVALFNVNMTRTDLPYKNHGYNTRLEIPDEVNK